MKSVPVGALAVATDGEAADLHGVAVEEPGGPARGVDEAEVAQSHVAATREHHASAGDVRVAHARPHAVDTPVEGLGLGVAVDRAAARHRHVRLPRGVEHRAGVPADRTVPPPHVRRREERILQRIVAALQRGAAVHLQLHVALEVERVGAIHAAAGHERRAAAGRSRAVDRRLDGRRAVGGAVGLRAEGRDVIDGGGACRREDRGRQRHQVPLHRAHSLTDAP